MNDRYVKVLQDFMINEKLCIMLDLDFNDYDRPTFLHYINEELDIIKQEYKDNNRYNNANCRSSSFCQVHKIY